MITTGKRYTPKEIERYVDAVTPEEIQRVAQKYLWDKDVRFPPSFHLLNDESWLTYSSLWLLLDEPRVSSITTESELVSRPSSYRDLS
jgi:predicted Zn-dependent peptidase